MVVNNDPMVKPKANLIKGMQRYRVWIFVALVAAYVISYFHRAAPAVVGTELIRDLSISSTSLGMIGSAYFWAYGAAVLPAGILADTLGSRKALSAFVMVAAVGAFIFGFGSSTQTLTLGRVLVGFGCGFVYIPAMRIMSNWYKPDELGTYSGILVAAGNAGAMVSAAPLVLLMNSIGWRNSFYVVGVVTVLAAIMAYFIVRDKPTDRDYPTPREIMGLAPAPPAPTVRMGEALKKVFSTPKFYLLSALMFFFYGTLMGIGSLWAGPYLQNVFGLSKQVASNIIMMFPLGMVIGCPLSGYLSDKILKSRKKILLYGIILHMFTYIPLIFFMKEMTTVHLYIIFLFYGITGGTFVNCFVCVKEVFEVRYAGTAMGALNVFVFAGGAFFQNVIGVVLGRYAVVTPGVYPMEAYHTALWLCLVGLIIGTVIFMFFRETANQ